MSNNSNSAELETAIQIARAAGNSTLKWFRNAELSVVSKHDGSPVTNADKAAEEIARELLAKEFPADSIWGEEFGRNEESGAENSSEGDSENEENGGKNKESDTKNSSKGGGKNGGENAKSSSKVWTIDPIDGTRSFISGVPTYSTLIARGNPELNEWDLGVIYIPALNELVYAQKGAKCWFENADGQRMQAKMSKTKKVSQAKIVASGADYVPDNIIQGADIFRTWGDGYGYLLLATGQVDAMLDIDLAVWDYAPMQIIIPEAGGEILDWKDAPIPTIPKPTTNKLNQVSTNKALTKDLKKYLDLS